MKTLEQEISRVAKILNEKTVPQQEYEDTLQLYLWLSELRLRREEDALEGLTVFGNKEEE